MNGNLLNDFTSMSINSLAYVGEGREREGESESFRTDSCVKKGFVKSQLLFSV